MLRQQEQHPTLLYWEKTSRPLQRHSTGAPHTLRDHRKRESGNKQAVYDSLEFREAWVIFLQSLHILLPCGAFSGEAKRAVEQEAERPHESGSTKQ